MIFETRSPVVLPLHPCAGGYTCTDNVGMCIVVCWGRGWLACHLFVGVSVPWVSRFDVACVSVVLRAGCEVML